MTFPHSKVSKSRYKFYEGWGRISVGFFGRIANLLDVLQKRPKSPAETGAKEAILE
jgi:hypothetical protein